MSIEIKDYVDIARGRYTEQFKNKPNFDSLIYTWLQQSEELQQVVSGISDIKFIERAEGQQLDNIGEIVGQSRLLIDANLIDFFGFEGISIARSYGDLDDRTKGGRWKSLGEKATGNITLSDDEYRLFLKSKIIRNSTTATTEDVIASAKFLFQADKVHLIEGEKPACYSIAIGKRLTQQEKSLLKYSYVDGVDRAFLVKPAGVCVQNYREFDPQNFFAFQGVRGAKGYGDILEVAEYTPYYESYGMYGYGDLKDIAETFMTIENSLFKKATTRYVGEDGDKDVDMPYNSSYTSEVYVEGALSNNHFLSSNRVSFPYELSKGTKVTLVGMHAQEVKETRYELKDPNVTELTRKNYESSFGDVDHPDVGSRFKSLGEDGSDNNIYYDGHIKKIEYKDPDVTKLTIGGIYSSIIN